MERRKQVEHTKSERKIMAMIHSPFVLCLRYAFQTPHKLYMLTDYCPGGELFFHLKKMRRWAQDASICLFRVYNRFSENLLRFYSAEIVLALHHIHSLNIAYRDMKPENVLLDRHGHVKLTDFGLSKVVCLIVLKSYLVADIPTHCEWKTGL